MSSSSIARFETVSLARKGTDPLWRTLQEHGYVRYCGIVGAHAFGGFCFDADTIAGNSAEFGYVPSNRRRVRTNFWSGEDQGRIQIDELVARVRDALQGFAEKYGRVCALPLGIGWGKERADVWAGDGSEECVGDGVEKNVSVGVAAQALVVGKGEASDEERDSGLELVRVPAVADAELRFHS